MMCSNPPKASYGVAPLRRTNAYCLQRRALSETFGVSLLKLSDCARLCRGCQKAGLRFLRNCERCILRECITINSYPCYINKRMMPNSQLCTGYSNPYLEEYLMQKQLLLRRLACVLQLAGAALIVGSATAFIAMNLGARAQNGEFFYWQRYSSITSSSLLPGRRLAAFCRHRAAPLLPQRQEAAHPQPAGACGRAEQRVLHHSAVA